MPGSNPNARNKGLLLALVIVVLIALAFSNHGAPPQPPQAQND